jgi:hypothetical protein
LVAVTTYCVAACDTAGVPDIIPVKVSIINPEGNEGDTDQEFTEPVTVGVLFAITTP